MSRGRARQALDPGGGLLAQFLLSGRPCPSLSESGDLVIYGRPWDLEGLSLKPSSILYMALGRAV